MTANQVTRRSTVALALIAMAGFFCNTSIVRGQTLPGWTLVWQDEFTQADGTPPDSSKWGYDIGGHGWGNNEWQYYTDRTNNARIETNHLIIEAHAESYQGNDYTSARLLTQNKWTWTYGRMEARIKVPYGQGIWPAFWMLGADIPSVGWPSCGEIDIMEHIGREPQTVYGTIHGPGYSGGSGFGGALNLGVDVKDDFHVFAIEWGTNRIDWFVDGTLYHSATPASVAPATWVFDHPHFLILNLAVGGNWPGYPDATTVFPQQLIVDYVRVYASSNTPPPQPSGTNVLVNPGFETGSLGPWVGYSVGGANALGTYIESTSNTYYNGGNPGGDNVLTHSGGYVGKIFGDFDGSENYNGCYQDIPASPGSIWEAGGWALTHAQDLIVGNLETWMEVTFRDASDGVLALYRSDLLTPGNVAVGTWMYRAITNQLDPSSYVVTNTTTTLTAPVGTAYMRYQLTFRQPAPYYDGGAMYYDDLHLGTPAVAVPVVLMAARAASGIEISFPTENGVSYDVEYKLGLTGSSDWTQFATLVGDGTTRTVEDSLGDAARLYRVRAQ